MEVSQSFTLFCYIYTSGDLSTAREARGKFDRLGYVDESNVGIGTPEFFPCK